MALQDLTPQLRTRVSKVERGVGLFVLFSVALMIAGFLYYTYHTAQRRGWFVHKVLYQTCLRNAAGIKPGDPVRLMGFTIGEVAKVIPNDPWSDPNYSVTILFTVRYDTNGYCGYIWSDSKVKVTAIDFLGNRSIEILKGQFGVPTLYEENGKIIGTLKKTSEYEKYLPKVMSSPYELQEICKTNKSLFYHIPYTNTVPIYLDPEESPALTEQLDWIMREVTNSLPNILHLTNDIRLALTNVANLASNMNSLVSRSYPAVDRAQLVLSNAQTLLADLRPTISNITVITMNLTNPSGSLGDWLIPTNLNYQLLNTLTVLTNTVRNTDTNLTELAENLQMTLNNLADITSNLNMQVQANTNILSEISTVITNTDNFIQGLKRHWLLRSAFKSQKTPSQPQKKN
ncbi:MAG: MlaD family protein [Verrucomicrobiia bacterium]